MEYNTLSSSLPILVEPRKSKWVALSDVLYVFALVVFIVYHLKLIFNNG